MKKEKKQKYEAPTTSVVDLKPTGILCVSGEVLMYGLDDPNDYSLDVDPFAF